MIEPRNYSSRCCLRAEITIVLGRKQKLRTPSAPASSHGRKTLKSGRKAYSPLYLRQRGRIYSSIEGGDRTFLSLLERLAQGCPSSQKCSSREKPDRLGAIFSPSAVSRRFASASMDSLSEERPPVFGTDGAVTVSDASGDCLSSNSRSETLISTPSHRPWWLSIRASPSITAFFQLTGEIGPATRQILDPDRHQRAQRHRTARRNRIRRGIEPQRLQSADENVQRAAAEIDLRCLAWTFDFGLIVGLASRMPTDPLANRQIDGFCREGPGC